MPADTPAPESTGPSFRTTLLRVIAVQVVALAVLWLLQARYHVL